MFRALLDAHAESMTMLSGLSTLCALHLICVLLRPAVALQVPESNLLPEDMHLLCGDIDVCRRNKADYRNQTDSTSFQKWTFCCTECSCDDTCIHTGTCCFAPSVLNSNSDCIFSSTETSTNKNGLGYKSYRMVSIDATEDTRERRHETNEPIPSCGQTQHPPFGELLPVYSKRFRMIYKNPACAASHGVTDGIIWQSTIICPNTIRVHEASFIQWLEYNMMPPACHVDFIYPGDRKDVQSHLCYRDMIDTCGGEPFTIPERMNLSIGQVRSLCESGFMSPAFYYSSRYMPYINVFCLICNKNYEQMLEAGSTLLQQCYLPAKPKTRNMKFWLKADYVTRRVGMQTYKRPKACKDGLENLNTSMCREVNCPLHHFPGPAGNCDTVVYASQAPMIYYKMMLNVTIEGVDVAGKTDNQSYEALVDLWNEINPWTPQTSIHLQLMQNVSSKSNIHTLFVQVILRDSQVTPIQRVLKKVHAILKQHRVIKKNNTEIKIHQSFAKCSRMAKLLRLYDKSETICHETFTDLEKHELNITPPLMVQVYRTSTITDRISRDVPAIYLNKLFFCEQVELQPHEFNVYGLYSFQGMPVAYALFNKLTGRLMLDSEFWLVTKPDGDTVARICLSDSGYNKRVLHTAGTGQLGISVTLMVVCCWICLQQK